MGELLMQADHPYPSAQPMPVTPRQLAFARKIAQERKAVLTWDAQQDRRSLSRWIDRHLKDPVVYVDHRPSSKQVAFAEKIARIKRRQVPDECFRDRQLMSRWIDSNKP